MSLFHFILFEAVTLFLNHPNFISLYYWTWIISTFHFFFFFPRTKSTLADKGHYKTSIARVYIEKKKRSLPLYRFEIGLELCMAFSDRNWAIYAGASRQKDERKNSKKFFRKKNINEGKKSCIYRILKFSSRFFSFLFLYASLPRRPKRLAWTSKFDS